MHNLYSQYNFFFKFEGKNLKSPYVSEKISLSRWEFIFINKNYATFNFLRLKTFSWLSTYPRILISVLDAFSFYSRLFNWKKKWAQIWRLHGCNIFYFTFFSQNLINFLFPCTLQFHVFQHTASLRKTLFVKRTMNWKLIAQHWREAGSW